LNAFSGVYFQRTFKTTAGPFRAYVSPSSRLKYLDPRRLHIEDTHQRFIDRWVKPDSIVWDFGANLGLFAFAAALRARAGHVYGFEPDPELLHYLHRSRFCLGSSAYNTSFFGVAVADQNGTAQFQISHYSRAMNKLQDAGAWHEHQIEATAVMTALTMSVDTLATMLRPPTILKIDVEGAEMRVLEGARETISRHRPPISIECPYEISSQMGDFFAAHDYALFDGERTISRELMPLSGTPSQCLDQCWRERICNPGRGALHYFSLL
jgi:FkbM family methyltransferase